MKLFLVLSIIIIFISCNDSRDIIYINSQEIYGISYSNDNNYLTYCNESDYNFIKLKNGKFELHYKFKMSGPGYSRLFTEMNFSSDDNFVVVIDYDFLAKIFFKKKHKYFEFQTINEPKAESRGLPIGSFKFVRFIPNLNYYILSAHSMKMGVPNETPQMDILNLWQFIDGKFKIIQKLYFPSLSSYSYISPDNRTIIIGNNEKMYFNKFLNNKLTTINTINIPYNKIKEKEYKHDIANFFILKDKNIFLLKNNGDYYILSPQNGKVYCHSELNNNNSFKNFDIRKINKAIYNPQYNIILLRYFSDKDVKIGLINLQERNIFFKSLLPPDHCKIESINFTADYKSLAIGYIKDESFIDIFNKGRNSFIKFYQMDKLHSNGYNLE